MVGVWCCGTVRHSIDLLRRRWSANIGLTSGKVVAGGSGVRFMLDLLLGRPRMSQLRPISSLRHAALRRLELDEPRRKVARARVAEVALLSIFHFPVVQLH